MKRREFIAGLGSAAAWPVVARAQQAKVPVIGFLNSQSAMTGGGYVISFRRGLMDAGYIEGQNVGVVYRWAEEHLGRLPALVDDLISRNVAVIVSLDTAAALAAKAATTTIPLVFHTGADPVEIGLVSGLSRPSGNITGISDLNVAVSGKRLEMLREVLPAAKSLGYLVNPANGAYATAETREMQAAAHTLGVQLLILNASDVSAFETAFMALARESVRGLVIGGDASFFTHYQQLVDVAARFAMPAMFRHPEAVEAGGLMSYATDLLDSMRQASAYVGRILKGEKPADLPVQQVTKMQLTINMKTAKALGLTIPLTILGRADKVIE
jgi:putative tryptophan/tyrosine transport system substrate-binding protein